MLRTCVRWHYSLGRVALTVVGIVGCKTAPPAQQAADERGIPLAKVGDATIYVADVEAELAAQSPYVRNRYASDEQKREFLDGMIRFELLAQEALRRGLDKDPLVARQLKQAMIEELLRTEIDQRISLADVTDADVAAYYAAKPHEFVTPAEVRASAIVVKHAAQALHVAQLAAADTARTNGEFRKLVSAYSSDNESKLQGGDLRYFARESEHVPEAVRAAAFALTTIGATSAPIAVGDVFYIIRLTAQRPATPKPLDDVRATIRNILYKERRQLAQRELLAGLRQKASIEVDGAALSQVRPQASADGASPMPQK